jgi:AAA-like domain
MIDRKPHNPYQFTTAVHTSEMFFGRTHILRQIYSAINNKQNISLVGSRRIGKSSILTCMLLPEIQKRFEFDFSRYIFVSLNMAEYRYSRNCRDFFQQVNKQILDEARKVMKDLELEPEGEQEDFAELLSEIKARKFHLVLLMDSFDSFARNEVFDADFFIFLRSQWRKVSYVTASTVQLSKVSHQQIQDSPFWNIFSQCTVGALTPDEACHLVTDPAARAGLPFTEGERNWLITYAGYHPFFLHCACRMLFDEKCAQNVPAINLKSQEQKIYASLLGDFEDAWDHLEQRQQEILKQEMQQKDTPPSSMPEFSSSKLFQRFIRERYHLRIFKLTVKELESALEQTDDPQELGKSNLRFFTLVSRRITPDTSFTQKGVIICDVLKEAHERMRGSGARTDGSFDWRLYNILYYRYLKYHLKHEQISARLGFSSTRQYFRERTKALETLLNELLKMEEDINKQDD